ncbi:VWA domain-containing protein [Candidatus Acidianus copahuensis]|uniref:VWA domain-containing protein n=1 Tax=Candidatus Acidianus copahuensis TaxID=1160895 RepID=UPI001F18A2BE|nr:VWA domain-containing protein [Candidatus Acidianus copahuensis]
MPNNERVDLTVSLKVKSSHIFVSQSVETEAGIVIYIVPEYATKTTGIRYVIALDNSPSMKGEKYDIALESMNSLLSQIPQGNEMVVITFSNHPKIIYRGNPTERVDIDKEFGSTTRFYEMIQKVIEISKDGMPTKVILLTDGKPTDKRNVKDYEKLSIPPNLQFINIGIGRDYNEVILKNLADRTAGFFYHVEDISQLPSLFRSGEDEEIVAKNLRVEVPETYNSLNYKKPIRIPILQNLATIYGTLIIPASNEDYNVTFLVTYQDPVDSKEKTLSSTLIFKRGDREKIHTTVNSDVLAEIRYYRLLKEYSETLEHGKDATKVIDKLKSIAEETRNPLIIEETKKLTGDSKNDLSEITKKMRS